jgi:hypothetical protein
MKTLLTLAQWCAVLTAVVALAVIAQPAAAATFTVSYTDGGTWNTVYVQGFSPAVEPNPDLSLSAGSTVNLEEFSFFKSGNADGNSNIQLAILDTIWYDFNTQLTTSSAALVGLSSNTFADTTSIATGDPITFDFNGLPLTNGSDYAAVAVNVDGGGNVTPVKISALTADYVETPAGSGTWKPETNYGGDSVWQYATSNYINAGYFSTFGYAGDADFVASFSVVPEPASILLAIGGAVLVACGCRRRTQA